MSFLSRKVLAGCLAVLGTCLMAQPAQADFTVFSFKGVTNDSAANIATGEAQLTVTVSTVTGQPNQVDFTFNNSGPNASSITDIYFDDGSLLGIAQIFESGPGVNFSQGASPGDLPGGNAIDFNTSEGFLADSDPAAQPNGVNPGEWVTIRFNLIAGQTYDDTIDAIQLALATPGVDVRAVCEPVPMCRAWALRMAARAS